MRIGLFKRMTSYILDMTPIITLVYTLHALFLGSMMQNSIDPNYVEIEEEYFQLVEERTEAINGYYQQYEDGIISEEEYYQATEDIQTTFFDNHTDIITVVTQYWTYSFAYYVIAINVIYFVYVLLMKGQTFGRKIMKIELLGNIKWHTLLLREMLWKNLLYTFPLVLGLAVNPLLALMVFVLFFAIDTGFIMFTKKKKTLRDMFSQTYLGHEGVNYPF